MGRRQVLTAVTLFFITLGKRIPARRESAGQEAATGASATEPLAEA
ncbi:hypothetical protein GCM10010151_71130 [Actinoallomurus spadix]|uniref:Uncharacterized protein n=1 Tax=Actinoallomurus spadix TaxID=79912 RepID=A0ABN0XRN0_9ACTN